MGHNSEVKGKEEKEGKEEKDKKNKKGDSLAGIIDRLDGMVENPKTIKTETLAEIRDELSEMLMDESSDYNDEEMEDKPKGMPSIVIALGGLKKIKKER